MAAFKFCPGALLLLSLSFCNSRPHIDEARRLAGAYAACTARYERILEGSLEAKDNTLADKKAELEKLLLRHEPGKWSDELELVRSKIMIEVGRYAEAMEILDRLKKAPSRLALEAKLQTMNLHILQGRPDDALALLRTIEPMIKKDSQLFNVFLALARTSPDAQVRKEYALKLVNAPELPSALKTRMPIVYSRLAAEARNERQMELARAYLEKAVSLSTDADQRIGLRAEIEQLALIGLPAPSLAVETWFNTAPLTPAALRGQVRIIAFWASWCPSCRSLLSTLQNESKRFQGQGLQVIGCTKLYGRLAGADGGKIKISAAAELASVKSFIDRNAISFPMAVGNEGLHFEAYAISQLPTLVFIDRRGNVARIRSGAGFSGTITEQIKLLLVGK